MEFVFLALAIAVCAALGYQLNRCRPTRRGCPIGISISIVLLISSAWAVLTKIWPGRCSRWPFPTMLPWRLFDDFAVCSGVIAVLFFLLWSSVRLLISLIRRLKNKGNNAPLGIRQSATLVGIALGIVGLAVIFLAFLSSEYSDSFHFPNYLLVAAAALLLVLWHRQLYRYAGESEAVVANIIGLLVIAAAEMFSLPSAPFGR